MWALVALALGVWRGVEGLKPRIRTPSECPLVEPPLPVHGCFWFPLRDPHTDCLLRYEFRCLEPRPENCGGALLPPERRADCAFVSIHDSNGCIVDFQCEPADCPKVESKTEIGCVMIPRRDSTTNCIQEFICAPAPPRPLPNSERVGPMLNMGNEIDPIFVSQADQVLLDDEERLLFPQPQSSAPEPILAAAAQVPNLAAAKITRTESAKLFEDPVFFSAIKPPLAPPPAQPILAAPPALAVQPIVPVRAPPVPVFRRGLVPRVRRPFVGCPPPPPRPLDTATCTWFPRKDRRRCIRQWQCEPAESFEAEIKCPSAPVKPDVGDRCNWIPILDKQNCIRKYECEPIPPEPCPPAPLPPDDHDRCKWVSIKDANDCILDYECVPLYRWRSFFRRY